MLKWKRTDRRIVLFRGFGTLCFVIVALIVFGSLGEVQALSNPLTKFIPRPLKFKKNREGMVYENPSKSLKEYDKFIIDRVVVHFAPNAEGIGIDPWKVQQVADFFHRELVQALSIRYQVVNTPGPGVLRLRVAITDIKTNTRLMNIHPGTKLLGFGLGGASMEGEAVDSQTGERVLAVVDSRKGGINPLPSRAAIDTVAHAKEVMRYWVKRFVGRVDKAHGY